MNEGRRGRSRNDCSGTVLSSKDLDLARWPGTKGYDMWLHAAIVAIVLPGTQLHFPEKNMRIYKSLSLAFRPTHDC